MKTQRKAAVAALVALCLWHLALRRHGFSLPLITDEGEYVLAARAWASGGLPYRDVFCQKPPMVFLLYRMAYAAMPAVLLAPRWLALFFSWGTMLLLYALAPQEWSLAARLAVPAVYGTLSTSPIGTFGFPANTELFLCAFTALSALGLKKFLSETRDLRWLFLSGLAAGAAVSTKQTALWTALVFGLMGALRPSRRADVASGAVFTLGALIVPASWGAYFAWRGALSPFLDDVLWRNARYAGIVAQSPDLARHLGWFFGVVAPLFLVGDWPAWALAAYGLAKTKARWESAETLTTLWLGASLTGAVTGLWLFPYYFLQALPPLALAAALGVERLSKRRRAGGVCLLALLCLYPAAARARSYFLSSPQALARRLLYPYPIFEGIKLADYIRAHSRPEETMYIFGSEPHIYVYAERRCATEHIFSYPLTLFPRDAADIERELAELDAARPKFILYSAQPGSTIIVSRLGERFRDGIRALLRRDYRWVGEVDIGERASDYRLGAETVGPGEPDWSSPSSLFLFELNRS